MRFFKTIIILFIICSCCLVNAEGIINFKSSLDIWDVIGLKVKNNDIIYDFVYKKLDSSKLKLDIYYPLFSAEKSYPVIIFIHGGGFITGDKNDVNRFSTMLNSFLDKGWAVISINYSLISENTIFPDNLDDVKGAVNWVYDNAEKYELNREKIGLWGTSAGGNLALMTALTYQREKEEIGVAGKIIDYPIDFVISFAGPTDLLNENLAFQKEITSLIIGGEISKKVLKQASPLYFISKNVPPVLIVHGKNDIIVPYEQSKIFFNRIKEVNRECRLISLDSGHTIHPGFLSGLKDKKGKILEFIEKYF